MLDGSANAAGNINFGCDHFARLPDLERVIAVAGIARTARCADGAAEQVRQLLQRLEAFRALDAATAGNDDFSFREVDFSRGLANDVLYHGAEGGAG